MDRGAWRATVHGVTTDTTEQAFYIAMCLHTLLFLFFNVTMLSIATAPLLIPCLLSPQLLWVAHFPTQN